MEFLTAQSNWPFSIALTIVTLLGLLEALGMLLGGMSSLVDMHGPDWHAPDLHGADFHAPHLHGADLHAPHEALHAASADGDLNLDHVHSEFHPAAQVLSWLHVGQLPTTILLLLFLLSFGMSGLFLQWLIMSRFGAPLPAAIASVPAGILALLGTRLSGGILKPLLPRDESEAVSLDSFVGCDGQITIGTARPGKPAEARVKDKFGRTHYMMVEPDGEDEFPAGSHVLLLKRRGEIYRVIDNTGAQIDDLV